MRLEDFRQYESESEKYLEVIYYCDNYRVYGDKLSRSQEDIDLMHKLYGSPTPELRQWAKDKLKDAYLRYWETI